MTNLSDSLIVIPCLNEEEHLPALLGQLLREAKDSLIVVADGGSTDRSREIVREFAALSPNVVLMPNPRRLQAAGVNLAVRLHGAGRTWLVRMDAHAEYPENYVAGLLHHARETGATSVVVPMVSQGASGFQIAAATAQNSVLGTGGSAHRHVGEGRFIDHGHHALMAIDLFQQVGGYREDMPHNEDAELDVRLVKAGGRIWLEPSLAITYYPRRDPLALWRQYRGYGRGRARTVRLHGQRLKLRQALPLAIPLLVLLALLAPFSLAFAAPLAAWVALCLAAGVLIGLREGSPSALASGVPAMIAHLAWGTGFLEEQMINRWSPAGGDAQAVA